jgi:peptide deformylase
MRATLTESGGVGLAAPQVAVSRRFVLVELQEKRDQKEKTEKKVKTKDRDEADRSDESNETSVVLACLDPRIVTRSKEQVDGYEACLSIDGYGGLVRRAKWVEVSYTDLQGRKKTRRATDWEARIFQHEIDHLDGILYVDRLVGDLLPIEEMRRRREKRRQDQQRQHRPRHGSPQKDGSDENSSRLLRPRAFASGSVVLAALLGLLTLLSLSTPARARKRTKSKRCDSSRYDCAKKRPAAYDRRIKIIRRPARGQDRACLRRLRKAGVKFRILARVKGVRTPVEILSKRLGGVRYRKAWNNKRRFILDCRFAEALVTRGSRIRRAGIASIYFTSSWRYTYLKGERELSRHAHGMALDISAIDGGFGYASVVSHYEKGKWGCGSKNRTKKGKALRALFCALKLNKGFRAILTPDNDRYHRDHFHVEGVRSSMRLRPKKSRRRRRGGRKRRK